MQNSRFLLGLGSQRDSQTSIRGGGREVSGVKTLNPETTKSYT